MNRIARRNILFATLGATIANPLMSALQGNTIDSATQILEDATASGQLRAASIYARQGSETINRFFGEAKSEHASFLLGSISKPIVVTSLMTLCDKNLFRLDDLVQKFIPEFRGGARNRVTVQHLLTHVSGLPDQLPENATLRSNHAPLADFVAGTLRVPLAFEPGTKYEYSSMAIMLAAEIAHRLSGVEIKEFVATKVLEPLGMKDSAIGMGQLNRDNVMQCQVEFGAIESGGGTAESQSWNWNSTYWRELGAPWGGVQASASDVGRFLDSFVHPSGSIFSEDVARLMIRNQNPAGMKPRGLGFDAMMTSDCPGCSNQTFGHTGSTGTIAWADPVHDRVCVVLTTLPARATDADRHPRQMASDAIAMQFNSK